MIRTVAILSIILSFTVAAAYAESGGGGGGIFIDPERPRGYYAVSRGNKLAVVDTSSMTVIKEIPYLENPDGMAWYVAR